MERWSDVSINNLTFEVFPFYFSFYFILFFFLFEFSIGNNDLGKDSFGVEVHIKWTMSEMSWGCKIAW